MEERDDNAPSGQLALSRARSREAYAGPPKGGCLMAVEDSVAQDQIRAFVERILRMKEERKAIDADIREIYGEAKSSGFDKTVLGKLVNYVEKRAADANAVMESESLFDLYLSAYDSATGKVGMRRATHTHASEPQPTKAAGQAGATAAVGDLAHEPAADAVIPRTVENEAAEISTPITEQQASPKPASDLTSSPAPQGEVATHEPDAQTDGAGDFEREVAQSVPAHLTAGDIVADGLNRAAEFHEPDATPAGAVVANTSGVTGGESAATPSRADRIKALRPLCQRPEACGSSGGKKHCHSCVTAAESQEEHA
jgi:uncharacterized protein (UPF0335 family)